MRRVFVLLLALAAVLACAPVAPPTPLPTASPSPTLLTETPVTYTYTGLGLEVLDGYHAIFEIRFAGDYEWAYRLETRTDRSAVEHTLHLEGISASRDPGDVRVVTEEKIARMRGPGTDDECLQFPADFDLGTSFLTPDDLIDPEGFRVVPTALGIETVAGIETTRYVLRQTDLGEWRNVQVNLWVDKESGAALRYDLRAAGPDPLFDAGGGVLTGQLVVTETGPQTIEPVEGCEIDLPLPPDATRLVKLPGMVAFDSAATPDETVAFYQLALTDAGWEAVAAPETGIDATLLSYHRGAQTLAVNVEATDAGVHVELLLDVE
jgi:hypothetical protein